MIENGTGYKGELVIMDPVEALFNRLPAAIAHQLRQTHQQIHPFTISPNGNAILLCAVLKDMYSFTGVKVDEQGNTIVVTLSGDTPVSTFYQEGMPCCVKCITEYGPNKEQLRQEYSDNGILMNPPFPLEELLRNVRNSMYLRINPPIWFRTN